MLDKNKEAFMTEYIARYEGGSYTVCRSNVSKILKTMQSIENEMNINFWEIDYGLFTIATCMLFNQLSLSTGEYYLSVLTDYYQWGIDKGYTAQRINYVEQLDYEKIADNKGYIQAVYFLSYQDLIDSFKIAAEITYNITFNLYDFIVARLLFLGVPLEEIFTLPKQSLNDETHDVQCANYSVHLDDELYKLILHYNSDNYLYSDKEMRWYRRRKQNLDLMLPSSAKATTKVLSKRVKTSMRWANYTKHYKTVTKIYRIFRLCDVYRSGVFNRCVYDSTKKLYKDPLTNEFIYQKSNNNIKNYKSML